MVYYKLDIVAFVEACAQVPDSPPQDEREFEDDDGTKFVWDSTLRKFKPEGMDLPCDGTEPDTVTPSLQETPVEYTADMMVFDLEDEVVPTISQVLAAEQAQISAELEAQAVTANAGAKGKGKSQGVKRGRGAADGADSWAAQDGTCQNEAPVAGKVCSASFFKIK